MALEQSNIILPESLHLADFKRQRAFRTPGGPEAANGWPGPAAPFEPPENPPFHESGPKSESEILDFKSLQLVPGGLDNVLTSLEGYYLNHALMTAGGNRGRTSLL